jgi:hypothetical protein
MGAAPTENDEFKAVAPNHAAIDDDSRTRRAVERTTPQRGIRKVTLPGSL